MGGTVAGLVLASKWDVPFAVVTALRVAFGGLPVWAKATIFGILGSVALWAVVTRLRQRRDQVT
ncbi:hypothetical protein ACFWCB_22990 [Streptomyces sp. NPDC060048]|uniref:hypothetical protein n=1 Tax=unclassified Streptomyces TaxID=2593676 RepID=UPI003682782A